MRQFAPVARGKNARDEYIRAAPRHERPNAKLQRIFDRMRRVRRGDVVAFAELVERYWAPVVGRFIRQLGDRQEAEDLLQKIS